jgi:hypothetical protein
VAFFTNPTIYGSPTEFLENDTMSRRTYLEYREIVARCCEAGVLSGFDADTFAQVLWAGVHGVITAALHTRDFPLVDPTVLAEVMVTGLLNGFRNQQAV